MEKLKVMIVNDKVVHRKAEAEAVEKTGAAVVIHTAPNGPIALEWLEQGELDVLLMDVSILRQDGSGMLRTIKEKYPGMEVILTGEGSGEDASTAVDALEYGAFDFVVKADMSVPEKMIESMTGRLKPHFIQIQVKKCSACVIAECPRLSPDEFYTGKTGGHTESMAALRSQMLPDAPDLILIASSTGGPAALETIFKELPGDFHKPVLVIQHMPPGFINLFAGAMDKKCALSVCEAGDGDFVGPGRVLIAPGGMHMAVERLNASNVAVKFVDLPFVNGVKPSADILFESAARVYEGRSILAVILTGMGNDGVNGVYELKRKCRCYCITQSERSCVVYGMPKCVYEAGLSDETADLKDMAGRICRIANNGVIYHGI